MKKHILFYLLSFFFCLCSLQAQTQLTNIPTFYLTTHNSQPVWDKETWVSGHIAVLSAVAAENLDIDMQIRGRGNSTWGLAKKPYRIKLATKQNLLSMPARNKDWVLLANHGDKTLIRNAVANKISELLGIEYSLPTRFADVYWNGQFQGNYMITDQVEVAQNRVPVEEQTSTDTQLPNLSGGYLIEIDGFAGSEPVHFNTNHGMPVTVKYPKHDEINQQQRNYVQNWLQTFENHLFATNFTNENTGYRPLVDTVSLVNWYIASELTGNPDCVWSTYIYKKRNDEKLYFGPLWDMDIAFNNDDRLGDAVQNLMRDVAFDPRQWLNRLWQDDWFRAAVNRRWVAFTTNVNMETVLHTYIDSLATEINASQQANFTHWNVLNTKVLREQFLFPTYAGGVNYLKSYLAQRIIFLTASFTSTAPQPPTPPFSPENFYYKIKNEGSENVIDVQGKSLLTGANLQMWQPIENDSSQLWQIVSLQNSEFQILNLKSGLAMAGNSFGNHLIQTTPNTLENTQRWQILPVLTGEIYGLVNVASGNSANNSGGSTENGTPIIEWTNNCTLAEKINQHWFLEKMLPIELPSSVNEQFTIYNLQLQGNETVEIFDISGRKMLNSQFSILPSGVYIVKIQSDKGILTKKMVKK